MRHRSSKTFTNKETKYMTTVQVVLEDGAYRVEVSHFAPGGFPTWASIACDSRTKALEVATRLCRDAIARGRTEDVNQRSVARYA